MVLEHAVSLCLLIETVGPEQPPFSGVSGVCSAERSHLQTQQNVVGKCGATSSELPSHRHL